MCHLGRHLPRVTNGPFFERNRKVLQKRSIPHALFALVIAIAFFAPPAKAGTYTVPFCDRSRSHSTSSWSHSTTQGAADYFYMDTTCSAARLEAK